MEKRDVLAYEDVGDCNNALLHGRDDKGHLAIDLGRLIDSERLIDYNGGDQRAPCHHVNKLSPREMEPLTAICDTFLPSIDAPHGCGHVFDEPTVRFFRTSASMVGAPEHLGGLISEWLDKYHVFLLRLSLLLLSTWIGTVILCGRLSLSSKFPFIHSFSKLDLKKRQQIMLSWSRSWIPHIKKLFIALKMLVLFAFFTKIDDNHQNPSWEAIGYCGPDPDFLHQKKEKTRASNQLMNHLLMPLKDPEKLDNTDQNQFEREFFGPLYDGIVNMSSPREMVAKCLRDYGFHVSIHQKSRKKASSAPLGLSNLTLTIRCDAVVVGSGSGGGVVAGMLANAGYKVLVLEKGGYYARNNLSLLEGPSLDQMYESGGLLPTRDVKVMILAGSTVGGGSTINWSASFRTPKHVLEEWSNDHELELFSSQLYQEALDVICRKMGVQHDIDKEGLNNEVLRRGCLELGYPVQNIPRNTSPDHYCGWCFMGCKDGKKKGNQETWLMNLVESNNGAILPGCEVLKVLHCKGKGSAGRRKAQGVAFEFDYKGRKEICLVESKVTVVACGALNTPPLLRRSGLKNPNIGKHLHLHPVVMGWGYFPEAPEGSAASKTQEYLEELMWKPENKKSSYEGGIMTAVSVVESDPKNPGYGAVLQTPSLHPGLFSVMMPWISDVDIKVRMLKFSRTAHFIALARDKGSGEVVGTNPRNLRYQLQPVDERNLKKGREKMLRILAAAGAEEIGTHDQNGSRINLKTASSHEFERFVKRESERELADLSTPLASAHQMGSCRMGIDPRTSAVNPRGETWEVEGLYVADSSVFPTALGINPMVTVMATAYCTAQSVLEVLKRKRST